MTNEVESPPPVEPRVGLFRKEAVESRLLGRSPLGAVFGLSPRWLVMAYWLLVAALVGVAVVLTFGRANEYFGGAALVMARTKLPVTTRVAGMVSSVSVAPGDKVGLGQPLVQLASDQEDAERHRLELEFERLLARSLLDRSDRAARDALSAARSQLQGAQARVAERVIRAPRAGVVSDVRIRPGQYLEQGALVLTEVEPADGFRVVALLPGATRPQLKVGMALRLELQGYPYLYQTLAITEVSEQVVGPAEARRFLGSDLADAVSLPGPVVLVQADLLGTSFEADGKTYGFHDGMVGNARVAVRSVPVAYLAMPWLRRLFQGE